MDFPGTLTGTQAAAWFLLLLGMVAVAGYLAGSAGYFLEGLLRRTRTAGRRRIMWMHLCLFALMLGYYSHVFLPVLLVSAHSGWLHQYSRRIRLEKKRSFLAAMARMRVRTTAAA